MFWYQNANLIRWLRRVSLSAFLQWVFWDYFESFRNHAYEIGFCSKFSRPMLCLIYIHFFMSNKNVFLNLSSPRSWDQSMSNDLRDGVHLFLNTHTNTFPNSFFRCQLRGYLFEREKATGTRTVDLPVTRVKWQNSCVELLFSERGSYTRNTSL